jgi:hypothetical protein
VNSFPEWRAIYEPIYGALAGRSLYAAHRELEHSLDPDRYRALVPASARRALGEFYTPDWLVEFVLDRAGYSGERLLDPACGAGAFLVRAENNATGWDINPLAVKMARARCPQARIKTRDVFMAEPESFEFIAGNPPWINWRNLGALYRERVAPLWEAYGLFTQRGMKARLGGAMDDISALMTYVCADRHLITGGRLAFLLPAALFQSAAGGAGFRRFRLPGGEYLRVVRVEEVGKSQPFKGASTRAAVAVFEKSRTETVYPVPYVRDDKRCFARPIAKSDLSSPWSIASVRKATSDGDSAETIADPRYRARVGVHSGGAAGVYWIEVIEDRGATVIVRNLAHAGRKPYPQITEEVEREFVHPLVRGRDLSHGHTSSSCHILLPHTPDGKPVSHERLQSEFPLTFGYFERFRDRMIDRPHYRRHFLSAGKPYWSMYNVGPYTFAPHRVAWREQSSRFECAVLRGGLIADAKLVIVPCESEKEAKWLARYLRSDETRTLIESFIVRTQISTHVLKYVRVPIYSLT